MPQLNQLFIWELRVFLLFRHWANDSAQNALHFAVRCLTESDCSGMQRRAAVQAGGIEPLKAPNAACCTKCKRLRMRAVAWLSEGNAAQTEPFKAECSAVLLQFQ